MRGRFLLAGSMCLLAPYCAPIRRVESSVTRRAGDGGVRRSPAGVYGEAVGEALKCWGLIQTPIADTGAGARNKAMLFLVLRVEVGLRCVVAGMFERPKMDEQTETRRPRTGSVQRGLPPCPVRRRASSSLGLPSGSSQTSSSATFGPAGIAASTDPHFRSARCPHKEAETAITFTHVPGPLLLLLLILIMRLFESPQTSIHTASDIPSCLITVARSWTSELTPLN